MKKTLKRLLYGSLIAGASLLPFRGKASESVDPREDSPVLEDTQGVQRVGIFLLSFEDRPFSFPFSSAYEENIDEVEFHNTLDRVSSFYEQASYGKMTFSFEVVGTYNLRESNSYPICSSLTDAMRILTRIDGDDERKKYPRLMYVFPHYLGCNRARGTIGRVADIVTPGEPKFSEAYIPTSKFDYRVLIHELGHNLGLRHANALDCGDKSIDDQFDTCTSIEYDDVFDPMGTVEMDFNALHKEKLLWFNDAQIEVANSPRLYTLSPLANKDSDVKLLKIPRKHPFSEEDNWCYVEYRHPSGLDDVGNYRLYNEPGLLFHIRYLINSGDSHLVDPSPNDTNLHAALGWREVYYDRVNDFTVTLEDRDEMSARVKIDLSPPLFIRGDANKNGRVDISDTSLILGYLLRGGAKLGCSDSADANDDGKVDIADPIYLLRFLFYGEKAPPFPLAEPGVDPTYDDLGCAT